MNHNQVQLNEKQKEAIFYNHGPLLIIAGAGTGKTTVIVEKVKHLLKNNLARPEEILVLTFTEKAAFEMEERIDQILPYGLYNLTVSTFHGFANDLLKEKGADIGLPLNFKLMTEAESIIFLRKNLFHFNLNYYQPMGNPNKFLEALLDHFSRLRDENISEEDYLNFVKEKKFQDEEEKKRSLELTHAYLVYQKLKIKNQFLDFSDLIYYLYKLLRSKPNILKQLQNQYRYLLIDEFQDTNFSQYELIKLLAPSKSEPNLTVVGDDNQSIYKFRGASISNILNFIKDYPQAKIVTLTKNYRSNQTILDHAYRLIKNNNPYTLESQLKISKKLSANKDDIPHAVNFFYGDNITEETDFVVKKIKELIKKNYRYADIALLVRANNHADSFVNAFLREGIPYQFLGPNILFKQPEIKDLIAFLKFIIDPFDSISLYRLLIMDIFNLDKTDLIFLNNFAKKINQPLYQTIEIYLSFFYSELKKENYSIYEKYLPLLKKETKEKLYHIFKLLNSLLKLSIKKSAGQILYLFLEKSNYLTKLVNPKNEKEQEITINISKFFDWLKNYESSQEDNSISNTVEFLEMTLELKESPLAPITDLVNYNAINILTVHGAKGLEFPVVFLVNLVNNRFPTREKKEIIPLPEALIKEILPPGDYQLQEERRLFYVGLTRAKDLVFLTASKFYGEGKRQTKISPFVVETLGEKKLTILLQIRKEEKNQLSIFDFKPQEEKTINKILIENRFFYSAINTYLTCPLQYKYQYLLKIPTETSAPLSFGNTIHTTLQKFYRKFLSDKKVDEKVLIELFDNNWIPLGYHSSYHENRAKEEGKKMLINYYKNFHRPDLKIIALEKPFRFKLGNNYLIVGKIDRIDINKNDEIEIIDYKTGEIPDEKKLKNDLQLTIYTLALLNDQQLKPSLDKITVSYHYLQKDKKISLKKTVDEIEKAKIKIVELVEKIHQNFFDPKVGPWCDFCPFRIICEAWQ